MVISAIVEAMSVAFRIDRVDNSKVSRILREWNIMYGSGVDYSWESKSKRRYRTALEKAYGTEDGAEYVAKKLGTIEEGLEKMRERYHKLLKLSRPVVVSKVVPLSEFGIPRTESIVLGHEDESSLLRSEHSDSDSDGAMIEMDDMASRLSPPSSSSSSSS